MRHSYLLGAFAMMHVIIGFVIALAVGLTGIGGGSFTVPALLLIAGLPPAEAVGTTFVFAGVLRLVAAPFYLAARQVHSRYFRLLLAGAGAWFFLRSVVPRNPGKHPTKKSSALVRC